jgi:apoptosis-inducing factor 3
VHTAPITVLRWLKVFSQLMGA